MLVFVLSKNHKSEPYALLSLSDLTSSRFFIAVASIFKKSLPVSILRVLMLSKARFCVSLRYAISAPDDITQALSSSIPNGANVITLNCVKSEFLAFEKLNSLSVKAENLGKIPCRTTGISLKRNAQASLEIISTGEILARISSIDEITLSSFEKLRTKKSPVVMSAQETDAKSSL